MNRTHATFSGYPLLARRSTTTEKRPPATSPSEDVIGIAPAGTAVSFLSFFPSSEMNFTLSRALGLHKSVRYMSNIHSVDRRGEPDPRHVQRLPTTREEIDDDRKTATNDLAKRGCDRDRARGDSGVQRRCCSVLTLPRFRRKCVFVSTECGPSREAFPHAFRSHTFRMVDPLRAAQASLLGDFSTEELRWSNNRRRVFAGRA